MLVSDRQTLWLAYEFLPSCPFDLIQCVVVMTRPATIPYAAGMNKRRGMFPFPAKSQRDL